MILESNFTKNEIANSYNGIGAIYVYASKYSLAKLTEIRKCRFIENKGYKVGGIYIEYNLDTRISECQFYNNTAKTTTESAGGLYILG